MPVTDEQIQAAISQKQPQVVAQQSQPAQQGVSDADIQAAIAQKQGDGDDRVGELLKSLGGKIPSSEPSKVTALQSPFVGGFRAFPKDNKKQQEAFDELLQRGLTSEQIGLTLQAQKTLDRPRIGRGAGGIAGALAATAIAGRVIPGPFDDAGILAALIASGGAGLGGIGGEALQTGIEEKRLISKREALGAFATEVGTELGGRALTRGGKLLFSPFTKKTIPEAAALVDDFAKVGGTFSPTELDKRFSLNIAESFSRGSFGAKQIFQEFEERQGGAVLAFADNIVEAIGEGVARQTPEEIGQIFADGIIRPGGRVLNILDDLVDPLYKQVDDLAKEGSLAGFRQIKAGGPAIHGVSGKFQAARKLQRIKLTPKVSTKTLKSFASKELARDSRLSKLFLSPTGRSKLTKISELGDEISVSDMRTLRSSFLKDVNKMARDADQSQGIIKQLAGITDQAIFSPSVEKGLSPEALRLLRNTNSLYKAAKQGIETTFPEALSKRLLKNPSSVIKEVFPSNNPKAIRLLRKSLVEPISGKPSKEGKVVWNQLRQQWLSDAVNEATKTGVVKPQVFDGILRKTGGSLKEMFPDDIRSVKKIQQLMQRAGKGPPAGTSLFSRSAQVAGLALMYKSGKEGDFVGFTAGGALAIGPLAFAKLATSPKGVEFLTKGFNIKPGSKGAVPIAVRMIRLLREINQKDNRQKIAGEQQKQRKVAKALTERKIKAGSFSPTPPVQPRQFPVLR